DRLMELQKRADTATLSRWAKQEDERIRRARQKLAEADPLLETVRKHPLDAELAAPMRHAPPAPASIAPKLLALEEYLLIADKWYAFIKFQQKSRAAAVLRELGLALGAENARRARALYLGLRARLLLQEHYFALAGQPPMQVLVEDA